MKATTKLRQMLNSGDMVVAPFVLNALHARIAESVGFGAVYMTGAGAAAERGFPDVGQRQLAPADVEGAGAADAPRDGVVSILVGGGERPADFAGGVLGHLCS